MATGIRRSCRVPGYCGLIALLILAASQPARSQNDSACRSTPAGRALDFWLGDWRVIDRASGTEVGQNRIEATLGGCAVTETWVSADGGEGKSLFAFDAVSDVWTQLWVTANTARPGGMKIKTLVAHGGDGSVVFEGGLRTAEGVPYRDRTTLTPLEDGRVRQQIDVSINDGQSWRTTFDALYLPADR